MADDQDLALASSVLEAEFRAFLPVELPAWRCLLQHNGAMHLFAQFLDFVVVSGHIHSSRLSAGAGLSGRGLVFAPAPEPRDGRAARARGTRGSLRRTLVARPALAVAISAPSLLTRSWTKPARTEKAELSRDDRRAK